MPRLSRPARLLPLAAAALAAGVLGLELGVGGSSAAPSSHAAVSSTLHAYDLDDYSIGVTFDDGSVAKSVPPGTYTLLINDQSQLHNFHFYGAGLDDESGVTDVQTLRFTVNLTTGIYNFVCDVHPDEMAGTIVVGSGAGGGSTTTTTGGGGGTGGGGSGGGGSGTTTTSVTAWGGSGAGTTTANLTAAVSATGKLTLASHSKAVTKLKAGRYDFVVTDKSKKSGFSVQKTGAKAVAITSAAYVGKHGFVLKLTAGKWSFFSPGGTKKSFTVA
ncbi:MAG TPA: hypothetical protein VGM80_15780 [Gaiellaceae bacterium]